MLCWRIRPVVAVVVAAVVVVVVAVVGEGCCAAWKVLGARLLRWWIGCDAD